MEPQSGTYFTVPISAHTLSILRAPGPSPEEMVAEAEDPTPERDGPLRELTDEQLGAVLAKLPPIEQDMIALWFRGKIQAEIAAMWGLTQAACSYRLMRAIARLRFFIEVHSLFTTEDVERDLNGEVSPLDLNILGTFWGCTSQTVTAQILGLTQGRVRHRLYKTVRDELPVLAARDPGKFGVYSRGFSNVLENRRWNIAREVPVHWRHRAQ